MNTQTAQQTSTFPTMSKCFRIFYVWSRVWPSPHKRYEGFVWGSDEMDAGNAARKEFGSRQGKVYDLHDAKHGRCLRKGA